MCELQEENVYINIEYINDYETQLHLTLKCAHLLGQPVFGTKFLVIRVYLIYGSGSGGFVV